MAEIARHLSITGHVQGVFYRDWAIETARALGLAGWVRNRRDGSVEAVAAGEADAVDRFVALCREGSPASRVEQVTASEAETEALTGFAKRETA